MSQNICNICGANYEYRNGRWKCPACGAFKAEELSNEEVTLFYNAAQKLRLCDFDEAEKAYTDIIEKFPKNPNGYWGRLLSRYGIKYEEDFDGRKIPTCYATSIESVISDKDALSEYRKSICPNAKYAYQKENHTFRCGFSFWPDEGFERAAPVRTLVQKLRAGEQFLARGRVHRRNSHPA